MVGNTTPREPADERIARRRLTRLIDALPVFSGFASPDGHLLMTRPPTQEAFLWALPLFSYSHDSITQIVDLCERAARGEDVQVERPYRKQTGSDDAGQLGRGLLRIVPVRDEDGFVDELGITLIDCDVNGLDMRDERAKVRLAEANERIDGLLSLAQTVIETLAQRPASARRAPARDAMGARLSALARMITPLSDPHARTLPLDTLLGYALEDVDPDTRRTRLTRDIAPSDVAIEIAPIYMLMLWELARNAVEHGAWRDGGEGRVVVDAATLDTPQGRVVRLHWIEDGVHNMPAILSRGFGLTLGERLFAQRTGGASSMLDTPDGMSWTLEVPAAGDDDPGGAGDDLGGGFTGGFDGGGTAA